VEPSRTSKMPKTVDAAIEPSQSEHSRMPTRSSPFTFSQPEIPMSSEAEEGTIPKSKVLLLNHTLDREVWNPIKAFAIEKNVGRQCQVFGNIVEKDFMVDLIITEIPDNLPIPNVSKPSSAIPTWNILPEAYFKNLFAFANKFLHDDGGLFAIYSDDDGVTKEKMMGLFKRNGFSFFKDWVGVNRLFARSILSPGKRTQLFKVSLMVRAPIARKGRAILPRESKFKFRADPLLNDANVDLDQGDAIVNFTTKDTQKMVDGFPWRGPKERDLFFMKSLILSASDEGDIIVDVKASTGTCFLIMLFTHVFATSSILTQLVFSIVLLFTGASIQACREHGRHLVALEEDAVIYKGLLQPLTIDLSVCGSDQSGSSSDMEDDSTDDDNLKSKVSPPMKRLKKKK
jgi:hypothetical protein